jgi:hypothetical protein
MSETRQCRILLGPLATELAKEFTGEPNGEGLEAGVRRLQDANASANRQQLKPHLEAVHEALEEMRLMLVALSVRGNSDIKLNQ